MKSVGVVICNYNKSDYVVRCIESVLNNKFKDFDLFVVDNASTDDSVEQIKKLYDGKLELIVNKENLGGSGGFNTGVKRVYDLGYKYVMLLDNDTLVDEMAIYELYNYLENNNETGMAGSKILQMQNPEYIQDFGGEIIWKNYALHGVNHFEKDNNSYFETNMECEYLAACALMVKREVIDKIGFMDAQCFIYWDDVEWSFRAKKAGYKCVVVGKSKVWHNNTIALDANIGFSRYYMLRNSFYFFAKYSSESVEEYSKNMLTKFYKSIVGYYCKKQNDMIPIIMNALTDFLNGRRGKVEKEKITRTVGNVEQFKNILLSSNTVLLNLYDHNKFNVGDFIFELGKYLAINDKLRILVDKSEWKAEDLAILLRNDKIGILEESSNYDYSLMLVEHVANVKECLLPKICVDNYLNCIYDEDTYKLYKDLDANIKVFVNMYEKLFAEKVKEIRESIVRGE